MFQWHPAVQFETQLVGWLESQVLRGVVIQSEKELANFAKKLA